MLKIGWSRRDVSTWEPIDLPGQFYTRISKGVMDPIMLNCLVVEGKKDIAVFLEGDFVSVAGLIDEIREKIKAKRGDFPVEKVMINASHTHCSPCHYRNHIHMNIPHEGVEMYPPTEYRAFLTDMAAEAVLEAYDNRAEGGIAYGYGYAVVSHSRRVTYRDDVSLRPGYRSASHVPLDGYARMYGETNDEMFQGYEGGADHYVNIMFTFDKEENLTGAIVNVPCPSQNSEHEYMQTADFWNEVRNTLRAKYGDIGILPQCAAAGDLSPRALHYKAAERRRYTLKYGTDPGNRSQREMCNRTDISERICAAFDEVFSWAKKDIIKEAEVVHSVKTILLEERLVSEEEKDYAARELERLNREDYVDTGDIYQDMTDNSKLLTSRFRLEGIVKRYEKQQAKKESEMELHVVKIGDIAFATNPFELYIDYQHQIQARSPFTQTFIVQLTGQPDGYRAGYLATERAVQNRGYSATMYDNQISAKGGAMLVEETLKELKSIY